MHKYWNRLTCIQRGFKPTPSWKTGASQSYFSFLLYVFCSTILAFVKSITDYQGRKVHLTWMIATQHSSLLYFALFGHNHIKGDYPFSTIRNCLLSSDSTECIVLLAVLYQCKNSYILLKTTLLNVFQISSVVQQEGNESPHLLNLFLG